MIRRTSGAGAELVAFYFGVLRGESFSLAELRSAGLGIADGQKSSGAAAAPHSPGSGDGEPPSLVHCSTVPRRL
jgi:hypothetical protein